MKKNVFISAVVMAVLIVGMCGSAYAWPKKSKKSEEPASKTKSESAKEPAKTAPKSEPKSAPSSSSSEPVPANATSKSAQKPVPNNSNDSDTTAKDAESEIILGYDEPLYKKGQAYEKAGKYVHALAAYWDAMLAASVPEKGEASLIAYDNLCGIIMGGKPGKNIKYDEFDLYDGWVALWNEYVDYWTANNSYYFTAKSPTRESLDMDAHTATYKSAIIPQRSMKFIDITRILQEGNEKSRTAEWKSVPADFENAISSKIPSYTDYVMVFDLIGGDGQRLCTSKSFTPWVETRAEKYVTVYNGTYGLGETYTWYDGPSFTVDSKTMKIIDAGDTWIKPVSLTCKGKKISVDSVDWSFSTRSFSEEWEKKGILVDIEGTRDGIWGGIEFDAPYRIRSAKEREKKEREEKVAQAEKERQEKAEQEAITKAIKVAGTYVTVPGGVFSENTFNGLEGVSVNSFVMSTTEITCEKFKSITGISPESEKKDWDGNCGKRNSGNCSAGAWPAAVRWYDAIKYCNLLSKAEGFKPCYSIYGNTDTTEWEDNYRKGEQIECDFSANGWRLPTMKEWEYAAKGGPNRDNYEYIGSDNFDDVAWCRDNSGYEGTCNYAAHPVAMKKPNSLGLYDMQGNLDEWCWEWDSRNREGRLPLLGGDYRSLSTHLQESSFGLWENKAGFRIVRTISDGEKSSNGTQKSDKNSMGVSFKGVPLGFTVQSLTKAVRKQINFPDKKIKGVVVSDVQNGSPASMMGLRNGDVITAVRFGGVGSIEIADEREFKAALNNKKKDIWFVVYRNEGGSWKETHTKQYTVR